MKRLLLIVFGGGAFVAALWGGWTFRVQNSTPTDLDLVWIRIPNLELWWLLLLTTLFGAALATLFIGFSMLRNKLLLRRTRAQVRKLEKEVHELRSLPLVGSEPSGAKLDFAGKSEKRSKKSADHPASAQGSSAGAVTPLPEKS